MRKYNDVFFPDEIALPNVSDYSSFAVVACDQFTSDRAYWDEVKRLTKGKETALSFILPEIDLATATEEDIEKIKENTVAYAARCRYLPKGYVLSVRETAGGTRVGLIGAVDLEKYDFHAGAPARIRATEKTIAERITPRLAVRRGAAMEFPHVLLFLDDKKKAVIEPLYKNRESFEKVYDFALNMGGGHLTGYFLPESAVEDALETYFLEKKDAAFSLAVGDGNHSLATAKTVYEEEKAAGNTRSDGRALVEIINLHGDGVIFHPIHRLVSGVDKDVFIKGLTGLKGNFSTFDGEKETAHASSSSVPDTLEELDAFIASHIKTNGGAVDYVHGEEEVRAAAKEKGDAVAILIGNMGKDELFPYVEKKGCLPKKTFSIGEGREKRYYLEGRKLKDL